MEWRMEDKLSDEDFSVKKHAGLLRKSASIYGKSIQRIQPPGRNEPSLEVSEFHLNDKKKINITKTLASSIDKTGKHVNLTTKVKKAQKLIKTLPTPLDHPKGEKIKRTVAFEAAKSILTRWVPLVNANKVTDCLEFPLNTPYFKTQSSESFLSKMKAKTPLEQEVEKMLSDSAIIGREKEKIAKKATFFLNRKEIMEQRRELARIRAQQSYREAKARRQNKIKSKKYHRILNRSNTRKQIQEFKELQKRDPEAAIKKLEELEKSRAEERVTLRHRSTGQWARNKTVRAKFKDCREQLEQQLRLGRDLKERLNVRHDSDDEDIGDDEQCVHENNPWMNKEDVEYKKFVNGYNVFCDQHKLRKTKDQEKLDKAFHVEDNKGLHEDILCMNNKNVECKEFINGYSNGFCVQHKLRKTKDQEKLDKASHVEDNKGLHEDILCMNNKNVECKEFFNGYSNGFCVQHKLRKTKGQEKLDKASHVEDNKGLHEDNLCMNNKSVECKEFINGYSNGFCVQHKLRKTKGQEKFDKASHVEDNKRFESSSHVSNGNARDESEERDSHENASGMNIGTTKNGFVITDNKDNPDAGISQAKMSNLNSFNRSWKCYEMKFESSKQPKEPGASVSERFSGPQDLDHVFENMELFLKKKFLKRASVIESQIEGKMTRHLKSNKTEKPISFLNGSRVLDMLNIDEDTASDPSQKVKTSSGIMDSNTTLQNVSTCKTSRVVLPSINENDNDAIDPKNIIHIREKTLNTQIPVMTEIDNNSEDEEAINNHMTIADAFTDDDVVAEFGLEKEASSEKDRPPEVLSMPGWGEWTGKGLPSFSRMNGHYTSRMSRPRKDEKKERLIIKEGADSTAKIHRVNELPFPFTSVERYEANIRAPLGSTWIPETAHRKLIAPKVSTKMGEAIEPLSETVLIDLTEKNVEIDEI